MFDSFQVQDAQTDSKSSLSILKLGEECDIPMRLRAKI